MVRLGVVPYLNALPLYHTLLTSTQVEVVRAVPSQLAPQLARGECDVALIPIVEHFRGVGETVISDACIGSSKAVRSVLLFHRVPLQKITSVAVDVSSRTSVALLRIVLEDGYGVTPAFIEHAPDFDLCCKRKHAALLIGDNALEAHRRRNKRAHHSRLGWLEANNGTAVCLSRGWRAGLEPERKRTSQFCSTRARDEGTQQIAESHTSASKFRCNFESILREASSTR
jgi:chorismate dehydratase